MGIEQRLKKIEKELKRLNDVKQNKKIYGYDSKGKPQYKDDISICKKCGKFFLYCNCQK